MTSELVAECARQELSHSEEAASAAAAALADSAGRGSAAPEIDEQRRPLSAESAAPALRQMRLYAELTGLPIFCVESQTGRVVGQSEPAGLVFVPPAVVGALDSLQEVRLIAVSAGLLFFALPLRPCGPVPLAAVGYVIDRPGCEPKDLVLAAAEAGWSRTQLEQWLSRLYCHPPALLHRTLELAVGEVERRQEASRLEAEIDQLSSQIDQTYEEISLLHSLTHNMQISRTPRELAEICVSGLGEIIDAQAHVVWIDEKGGPRSVLVGGRLPFAEERLGDLLARFADHAWSKPLVRNGIDRTLLGADFPGLQSLIVVPIAEGSHRFGWILSINRAAGHEFGSVEANLLSSMAVILGTHVRNIDLYQQHEDLILSFVRSLVSTIDAKDPYTRGHSERVALIGRRLGEELNLPEEDLRQIYLSGLLHDLGKIGVDDRILRKPGRLTDEEFRRIQEHPMIGYTILEGLNNLQGILPGVRNHHETYSGRGYPDRLAGEQIPLMARILAVADSYDAMGSDRPYRKGMPVEKIEEIFRRGAGEQWDPKVIDAYFRAADDIRMICQSYSPNKGSLLGPPSGNGSSPVCDRR